MEVSKVFNKVVNKFFVFYSSGIKKFILWKVNKIMKFNQLFIIFNYLVIIYVRC